MNKRYIFVILTFVKSFGVIAGRYIDKVNNFTPALLHVMKPDLVRPLLGSNHCTQSSFNDLNSATSFLNPPSGSFFVFGLSYYSLSLLIYIHIVRELR